MKRRIAKVAGKRRTFKSRAALEDARNADRTGKGEYPGGVNPTQPKRYHHD
jgi:hypothetical protein